MFHGYIVSWYTGKTHPFSMSKKMDTQPVISPMAAGKSPENDFSCAKGCRKLRSVSVWTGGQQRSAVQKYSMESILWTTRRLYIYIYTHSNIIDR